jgi:small subunit ribosomal protein S17
VVSDKMAQTVVVAVPRLKEHRLYQKKFKVTTKFKAHDAKNTYKVGDQVEIGETRPLSHHKRWEVVRKITAKEAEGL